MFFNRDKAIAYLHRDYFELYANIRGVFSSVKFIFEHDEIRNLEVLGREKLTKRIQLLINSLKIRSKVLVIILDEDIVFF